VALLGPYLDIFKQFENSGLGCDTVLQG